MPWVPRGGPGRPARLRSLRLRSLRLRSVLGGPVIALLTLVAGLAGAVVPDCALAASATRPAGPLAASPGRQSPQPRAPQALSAQARSQQAQPGLLQAGQAPASRAKAGQDAAAQARAAQAAPRAVPAVPAADRPAAARRIAWKMMSRFGWSARRQFPYLNRLWTRESGWRVQALNRRSGAEGIPQAKPGRKMASAGRHWRTSARTQIRWGLRYIKRRYGSPRAAWHHEVRHGWY